MDNNIDQATIDFLSNLHELIDWTNRWGAPRTPREEAIYFDRKAKVAQGEISLKPLVHSLRGCLESFIEDYRKEPNAGDRVGKEFSKMASEVIEKGKACGNQLQDADKELAKEVLRMINSILSEIKAQA